MDRTAFEVPPERLRRACPPTTFDFECTEDIEPLEEFVGQDRAIRAIEFGLAMDKPGFNVFVTGLTGTGKTSVIKTYLEKAAAAHREQPSGQRFYDWCYVHNFVDPDRPNILRLPPGGGRRLKQGVAALLERVGSEIREAFDSEHYQARRKEIVEAGERRSQELFDAVVSSASQQGFLLQMSPTGPILFPVRDGAPINQQQFLALSEDERSTLDAGQREILHQVDEVMTQSRTIQRETMERIEQLDRQVGEFAVNDLFDEVLAAFADEEEVRQYLLQLRDYTIGHLGMFRQREAPAESPPRPAPAQPAEADPFLPFRVNVFVDNAETEGPPVVIENNPTYTNLFGRIERRMVMGAYLSDHTMLKAGSVSLADGGYLVLNVLDVLGSPGVWEGLKRVIRNKEVRPEDPTSQIGFPLPQGLRPQPMPVQVKVVVTGDNNLYRLLNAADEDFWELFKVKADFDVQVDWSEENLEGYAGFVCATCVRDGLRPFERDAVAKVVEYGARLAGDQNKLSSRFGQLRDLLLEADHWAREAGAERVKAEHVVRAVEEKLYRSNLVAERIRELIEEGTLMVDTSGSRVGQVNGLAVYIVGDLTFGRPSRITARTFMGRRGLINIERESQLSGRTHDKGVLILSGYLGAKYAQDRPLSMSASICFEQSYEDVDGDSASSTELYAILSSLSGLPIQQGLAVTGSVNQHGEVQPIGGLNEKIEGFFDVCCARGLAGDQGVIVPEPNLRHLMLREDVVEAVKEGKFHIYGVKTIDEGIQLLTGVPAGERQPDGSYPEGTVNHLVSRRLGEYAEGLRHYYPEAAE